MRILIAVSCLLAVASAGYSSHYGGYHVPVIGPNGVPLDEPAVAAAKAHHFAAYAEAAGRAGAGYDGQAGYANNGHYINKWHGPIHIPVIGPHGVPIDEPAVQAARAQHAAAHSGHGLIPYSGHYGASFAHGSAVPHDTPEVAAAKAEHFAAHAKAAAQGGYHHYRRRRGLYYGAQHIPVIGPHGVPLDEPAVAAAKAAHFAAHAEAASRSGHIGHVSVAPLAYAGHYGYSGPLHYPVIGPGGVPVDEPAVQVAKAHHAAAHAEAAGRSVHYAHSW